MNIYARHAALTAALQDDPYASDASIATRTDIHRSSVQRARRALATAGLIPYARDRRGRDGATYRLNQTSATPQLVSAEL